MAPRSRMTRDRDCHLRARRLLGQWTTGKGRLQPFRASKKPALDAQQTKLTGRERTARQRRRRAVRLSEWLGRSSFSMTASSELPLAPKSQPHRLAGLPRR